MLKIIIENISLSEAEQYVLDSELDFYTSEDVNSCFYEDENTTKIVKSNMYYNIEEFNINIFYASCYTRGDSLKDDIWEVQFDFFMFFDSLTGEVIYEESGSSIEVSLYNMLVGVKGLDSIDIDYIDRVIKCNIVSKQ